jgi:hypothetical protein
MGWLESAANLLKQGSSNGGGERSEANKT